MPFLPYLHGLRGLAAMGVLLFHWSGFFPAFSAMLAAVQWGPKPWMNLSLPLANGWQGVPLFFVLSAYLLSSQWRDRALSARTVLSYLKRRVLRIYPAVWLQLMVLLCLPIPGLLPEWNFGSVFLNAVMWVHLPTAMAVPLNQVWWTLPVELGFYLVLPGLVLAEKSVSRWVVFLCCLFATVLWRAGCLWWFSSEELPSHLHVIDALPGSLATFAAGYWVAGWTRLQMSNTQRWGLLFLLALAYAGLQFVLWENNATYLRGSWLLMVWVPLLGLLIAALIHLLTKPLPGWRMLSSWPLQRLGELSFGIYLWHYPVQKALVLLWPAAWQTPWASVQGLLWSTGITLVLAWGSFELLERRFMTKPKLHSL